MSVLPAWLCRLADHHLQACWSLSGCGTARGNRLGHLRCRSRSKYRFPGKKPEVQNSRSQLTYFIPPGSVYSGNRHGGSAFAYQLLDVPAMTIVGVDTPCQALLVQHPRSSQLPTVSKANLAVHDYEALVAAVALVQSLACFSSIPRVQSKHADVLSTLKWNILAWVLRRMFRSHSLSPS